MKRIIFLIAVMAAALMIRAVPAWGQQVVSPDGTMASKDNLHQEKVPLPWQLEVSVRQLISIGYMPQLATIGARKGNYVYGLGAGHSAMTFDAYPATVYSIPFYAYNRIYIPMRGNRFSLYSDQFLGYQTVYKVRADSSYDGSKKGDGNFFLSWQPGISLRMWGKSNLFMGIVLTTTFEYPLPAVGLHLGLAL